MENQKPKFVILVVYKTKDKNWRGFCSPYDVSCEAENQNGAKKKLIDLVQFYEQGLEKYNYPKHLTFRALSNTEDKALFEIVKEKIAADIKEKLVENYTRFQERKDGEQIKFNDPVGIGCYYFAPLSFC